MLSKLRMHTYVCKPTTPDCPQAWRGRTNSPLTRLQTSRGHWLCDWFRDDVLRGQPLRQPLPRARRKRNQRPMCTTANTDVSETRPCPEVGSERPAPNARSERRHAERRARAIARFLRCSPTFETRCACGAGFNRTSRAAGGWGLGRAIS